MQRKDTDKNTKPKTSSVISLRTFATNLKRFFIFWLIAAIIVSAICLGFNAGRNFIIGTVSTTVNFSFDGIESGLDPKGNKFEVNDMKSVELIQESLDELGMKDKDAELICKNISIEGIIPTNVIDRITAYTPVYESEELVSSKDVQDKSYYPTQYELELECHKADLSKREAADLLNKLSEKYTEVFNESYGYNSSLENAVVSIDYREYDYVDAIDVFESSLTSLRNYINELASKDNNRFRAENGYTFADVSSSINTIIDEDLSWVSSYIILNNVTKDKELRIANYEFKIEKLKRNKIIAEEMLKSVNKSIDDYEQNSILIFGSISDGANASITQSSDIYNSLINRKIAVQKEYSNCEQLIKKYEDRIKSLNKSTTTKGHIETVEAEFEKLDKKIDSLLGVANETASEYYETILLNNAYTILSPASSSMFLIFKTSLSDSISTIFTFMLILTSVYIIFAGIASVIDVPLNFRFNGKSKKSKNNSKKKS